jgi:hypothetical protein
VTEVPSILVTCINAADCTLIIEPWGTEYTINAGESITVSSHALSHGGCEVSYSPGRIVVGITTNDGVQLRHSSRGELAI